MDEKKNVSTVQLLALGALAMGLLLLSSIGIFNFLFSLSEHLQSNYRSSIRSEVDDIEEAISVVSNIRETKKERDQYKDEVLDLHQKIENLKLQIREDEVITAQIQGKFGSEDLKLVPARVIRYYLEHPGSLVINKGERDGINVGDILIIRGYALGEVTAVNKYSSEVRTLLSNESTIPVISDNGVKGVLVSRSGNELEVSKVLVDADVTSGEGFTTLGINSNYPANLYVGEVVDVVSSASATTKTVRLKNDIDFKSLREVFVLKSETQL